MPSFIASKVVLRVNEPGKLGEKDVFWVPETKFNVGGSSHTNNDLFSDTSRVSEK